MNEVIPYLVVFAVGLLIGLVLALFTDNRIIRDMEIENNYLKEMLAEAQTLPVQTIEITDNADIQKIRKEWEEERNKDYFKPF